MLLRLCILWLMLVLKMLWLVLHHSAVCLPNVGLEEHFKWLKRDRKRIYLIHHFYITLRNVWCVRSTATRMLLGRNNNLKSCIRFSTSSLLLYCEWFFLVQPYKNTLCPSNVTVIPHNTHTHTQTLKHVNTTPCWGIDIIFIVKWNITRAAEARASCCNDGDTWGMNHGTLLRVHSSWKPKCPKPEGLVGCFSWGGLYRGGGGLPQPARVNKQP